MGLLVKALQLEKKLSNLNPFHIIERLDKVKQLIIRSIVTWGNSKVQRGLIKKTLTNSVIHVLQVNVKCNDTFFTLHFLHTMKNFLGNNDIIRGIPPGDLQYHGGEVGDD